MKYNEIIVRFGELSTKGKNKKDFIKLLYQNMKHALKDHKTLEYRVTHDHIYVVLNDENQDEVIKRLQSISGIYSLSLVVKIDADIENIKAKSLELISQSEAKTFKVKARRTDKSYPFTSDEINRLVAGEILKNTAMKVDVHNPEEIINIEIHREGAYLFLKTVLGAGGYPLGIAGKAMMMISGGIDSPVAAYLLMKRGIKLELIHFASPPYTQSGVIDKIKDLVKVLNLYQESIRIHVIPFTKLQEEIYRNSDESYAITIMRRMMYRLAERLAHKRNCAVIANGESIGQVASQTLQSMAVINKVVDIPVIRPLATEDKINIISIAKKIGTYDISIRPYEDCCTIFAPKAPKTQPHIDKVTEFEVKFDYETLIYEAIKNEEVIIVSDKDEDSKYL